MGYILGNMDQAQKLVQFDDVRRPPPPSKSREDFPVGNGGGGHGPQKGRANAEPEGAEVVNTRVRRWLLVKDSSERTFYGTRDI